MAESMAVQNLFLMHQHHALYVILVICVSFTNMVRTQSIKYNGPASIDYFKTAVNVTTMDNLPVLTCHDHISDSLNHFFGETNASNPVIYYTLNITSEMQQLYSASLHISTCCELSSTSHYYPNTSELYDHDTFCSTEKSLDTNLYVLQEKKGQINLIDSADDSTCFNSQKSDINLLNYRPGGYIIGVGGYANEYGNYYLQLSCFQYSYPITKEQFHPPINSRIITCGSVLSNQEINYDKPVIYYLLNVTKTTYLPFTIYSPNNNYTVIYMIKQNINTYDHYDYDRLHISDITNNSIIFDDTDISIGVYYLVIQGVFNRPARFSLTMSCSDAPTFEPTQSPITNPTSNPTASPTSKPYLISSYAMEFIVFGAGGFFLFVFLVYYIYKCVAYYNTKSERFSQVETSDASDVDEQDIDDEKNEKDALQSNINIGRSIKGVSIRRIDADMQHMEEKSAVDMVQLVLAHAIKCCEDQNGFDIFQVLSIRSYEKNSRNVVARHPFKTIGINIECMQLSPWFNTMFRAVIIAACQTWGITVVVYKLISAYFYSGIDKIVCDMEYNRWIEVFSLKILSFLLSLVITMQIGILMTGIQHNGLYEIMQKLSLRDIKRIDNIAVWVIQIGQVINYYVCLIAILGSYFIIFESNKGEEINNDATDYSHSGLDMILNAVALFFMLEIDDLMVTEQDYLDCAQHLTDILQKYKPVNNNHLNNINNNQRPRKDSVAIQTYNKCISCMIPSMYYFVNCFRVFVQFCCYVGGLIAPFVIFYCW